MNGVHVVTVTDHDGTTVANLRGLQECVTADEARDRGWVECSPANCERQHAAAFGTGF